MRDQIKRVVVRCAMKSKYARGSENTDEPLTESTTLCTQIHPHAQLAFPAPPSTLFPLRHDEQVESTIMVIIAWNDVCDGRIQ